MITPVTITGTDTVQKQKFQTTIYAERYFAMLCQDEFMKTKTIEYLQGIIFAKFGMVLSQYMAEKIAYDECKKPVVQ